MNLARMEMPDFHVTFAVWRHQYARFSRYWRLHSTWLFVEPAIVLLAVAVGVGRLVGEVESGLSYAVFVTPGLIMGHAMFLALFETSWNAHSRIVNGLYETQLSAPATLFEITLGDMSWAVTRSVLSVASMTAFAFAFGWLESWTAIGLVIPAVLVGVMFAAMGYLFSATVPYVAFLSIVFTLVGTPFFFFSGTFFPLDILPGWAEVIGYLLPLRPAVSIARGIAAAELNISHLWDFLYIIGLTAVMWPVGVFLLRRRLMR